MDVLSLAFLLLVIALGGVIAFFADRLGRTLGRKRLSLFGLRPRRTAELITVTAGVLIPLVTVAIVMVASSDVRLWIVEGRRAVQEVRDLRQQREGLSRDVETQRSILKQTETDLKATQTQLRTSQEESLRLTSKVEGLTLEASQLTSRVNSLSAKYEGLQKDYSNLQTLYEDIRQKREELETSHSQLYLQHQDLIERSIEVDREFRQLEQEKAKLESDIALMRADITERGNQLARLQSEFESAQARHAQELSAKQKELDEAEIQINRRLTQLVELENQLEVVSGMFGTSRSQPMIFAAGEEVARILIEADLSVAGARSELSRLLRSARFEAEARGARGTVRIPSAGIFEREIEGVRVSSQEMENRIIARLAGVGQGMVIVATSSINAFRGEPVSLDVHWFPNRLVFNAGEVVAESRIDGSGSNEVVLEGVMQLLGEEVRRQAKLRGMIPLQGPSETYGAVSNAQILDLVELVKSAGRRVRVQAIAIQETYAGDPLKLEFRLR